jgi:hypothetical protein
MTEFVNRPNCRPPRCESNEGEVTHRLINALAVIVLGAAIAFGVVAQGVVL